MFKGKSKNKPCTGCVPFSFSKNPKKRPPKKRHTHTHRNESRPFLSFEALGPFSALLSQAVGEVRGRHGGWGVGG